MSKNQPGGEAEACVKQRDQNSQRPKNEREHDGVEAVTEAHSEHRTGRKLVRDEAEGTQYRGQFIWAYLQVTGHNFNFIPRVSGVIEGD